MNYNNLTIIGMFNMLLVYIIALSLCKILKITKVDFLKIIGSEINLK